MTALRLPKAVMPLFMLCCTGAGTGCHSAFVEATLSNRSGQPVHLVELDYPSASFGTQNLANGANYHYRFKVLGQGPIKLSWTDPQEHEHTVQGPELHEGQEGTLTVTLGARDLDWQTSFQ